MSNSQNGHKSRAPNQAEPDFGRISHLMAGAQLEDGGLQSYRSIHLTIQSILVAIGTVLCVGSIAPPEGWRRILVPTMFGVFLVVAILIFLIMRDTILMRQKEVNWWLDEMKKAEAKHFPADDRFWSHYDEWKRSQFTRSVRTNLGWLDRCLGAIWLLLIIVTAIFTF